MLRWTPPAKCEGSCRKDLEEALCGKDSEGLVGTVTRQDPTRREHTLRELVDYAAEVRVAEDGVVGAAGERELDSDVQILLPRI